MGSGINRNFLSFEILDNDNPEILLFLDTSTYTARPESPLLELIPPGYSKHFTVNIQFSKINVLNSGTMGISDILETGCLVNLPDGVWTFRYKICPYDKLFEIGYSLRTTLLEQDLSKIYDTLDLSDCDVAEDDKIKKNVIDTIVAINSGKANAKKGNVKKASALYQIASDLISKTLKKIDQRCLV